MHRGAAAAKARCRSSIPPLLYLVARRGGSLRSSNGKLKPPEPSCGGWWACRIRCCRGTSWSWEKLWVGRLPAV